VEFPRAALEALRQPLEEGTVTVARVRGTLRMPARFQFVAAMNPCPCGSSGDPRRACRCTARQVAAYQGRLSGPLLDRVDLVVEVPPPRYAELTAPAQEASAVVAERVLVARERQAGRARQNGLPATLALNGRWDSTALRRLGATTAEASALMSNAVDRLGLSARGHDRVLRVARTIADLGCSDRVRESDLAEALHFRLAFPDSPSRTDDTEAWIQSDPALTRPTGLCYADAARNGSSEGVGRGLARTR
jgi:magnesium chelatase family protein